MNLFSRKFLNMIVNGGILWSPDDPPVTRVGFTRILEGMGVIVSKAIDLSMARFWLVASTTGNPGIDHVYGLPIKNIRFRIEFRPNSESSERRCVAATGELDGPYLLLSLRRTLRCAPRQHWSSQTSLRQGESHRARSRWKR